MKLSFRIDAVVERLRKRGEDIRAVSEASWILAIEDRIGGALPETYRNLVLRYSFPSFELGPVVLFSNLGDSSYHDITSAPFKDEILSRWVIQAGYFHFAQSSCGNYDPICLSLQPAEYPKQSSPVVKFDHEAILQKQAVVRREIIADSFLTLLEEYA